MAGGPQGDARGDTRARPRVRGVAARPAGAAPGGRDALLLPLLPAVLLRPPDGRQRPGRAAQMVGSLNAGPSFLFYTQCYKECWKD